MTSFLIKFNLKFQGKWKTDFQARSSQDLAKIFNSSWKANYEKLRIKFKDFQKFILQAYSLKFIQTR